MMKYNDFSHRRYPTMFWKKLCGQEKTVSIWNSYESKESFVEELQEELNHFILISRMS